MDVDREAAPAEGPAKKRRVKKIDAPFTSLATSTSSSRTPSKPDDCYALPRRPSSPPCPKRGRTRSTPKKVKTLRNPPASPSWTPSKLSAPHWAYREAEECSSVIAELRTTLNEYMSQATSSDEKFAHLDPKDTSRSMCSSNNDSIQ
ncbi:hypothetical protein BU15DRAFT_80888 [Melanogaster broomeanus]|nr:hypothetical protein BU15DRAFT_80888 [Melanogaster broomeanus]